ncbi:hypothetical protein CGCF415_v001144 [Colletotrichum fructicola]|nr:hypothetical protein CGCF415_v001144 [Colletotrichum fructicola]KAF4924837.1 hypothetical protein CGCF245_v014350 [Colletotrichum fructicola]
MSEIVRWKLERGATVGLLEQLNGSQTVGSTVMTLFSFGSFNLLSILLLTTWAFSPLGTQGLLRMESRRNEPRVKDITITYFDDDARSRLVKWQELFSTGSFGPTPGMRSLTSLYATLVTTPEATKFDTMDLWGNVRIPFLNHTENEWRDLPSNSSEIEYSSLAGIPISNLDIGNTTFNVESSYLDLRCHNATVLTGDQAPEGFFAHLDHSMMDTAASSAEDLKDKIFRMPNGTWHGYNFTNGDATTWSLALDRFVDPIWLLKNRTTTRELESDDRSAERERPILFRNETGIDVGPTTLLFEAYAVSAITDKQLREHNHVKATFGVTQKYVESRVACRLAAADNTKPSCRVISQRPSQRRHAPEGITHLSFPKVFNLLSQRLPLVVGGSVNYQADFSLYYLKDPTLRDMQSDERAFMKSYTAETLEIRLAQLLNTFLAVSQLSFEIAGRGSAQRKDSANVVSRSNETVPAELRELVVVVQISDVWAAVCLSSGVVLLAAGVMGVVFKHRARGPEIFGYISTIFRDSKYFDLPPKADLLDGGDLSKTLRELQIRYGNVGSKDGEPVTGVVPLGDTEMDHLN